MRSWRVRDTVTTNSEGHAISYHLEPLRVGHIHQGPVDEPFTNNQFYVTVNKPCEKFASHNPTINCAADVSEFANGESLVGQDIVLWYGITFHHLPRDEDEGMMDAHWDGFQIIPRLDGHQSTRQRGVGTATAEHADQYANFVGGNEHGDQYTSTTNSNCHRHPAPPTFTPTVMPGTTNTPVAPTASATPVSLTGATWPIRSSCRKLANSRSP